MDEDVEEVVKGILKGSNASRIKKVTELLRREGANRANDLKYFDWKSLEELNGLSSMEIEKVMRFVQQNFPDEYQEHKKKKNEELRLKRETELLNFKVEAEASLQNESFEREKVRKGVEDNRFEFLERPGGREVLPSHGNDESWLLLLLAMLWLLVSNIVRSLKNAIGY